MAEYVSATGPRARRRRRVEAEATSIVRRLDWILAAATGGIVAFGLWVISGVTRNDVAGNPHYYVVRQGGFIAIGLVALVLAVLIDPAVYKRYKSPIGAGRGALRRRRALAAPRRGRGDCADGCAGGALVAAGGGAARAEAVPAAAAGRVPALELRLAGHHVQPDPVRDRRRRGRPARAGRAPRHAD